MNDKTFKDFFRLGQQVELMDWGKTITVEVTEIEDNHIRLEEVGGHRSGDVSLKDLPKMLQHMEDAYYQSKTPLGKIMSEDE